MSRNLIYMCCEQLKSIKVTERKKALERLQGLLDDKQTLAELEDSEDDEWQAIFLAVQKVIFSESIKIDEGEPANLKSKVGVPNRLLLQKCHELLVLVVKLANQKTLRINLKVLISFLTSCLASPALKRHCCNRFVLALNDYILCKQFCWGSIEQAELEKLCKTLKELHKSCLESRAIQSFVFVVKHGPYHKMSLEQLRQQFSFIQEVSEQTNETSSYWLQETVIELCMEYSKQLAVDNRMLCCKFGELVLNNIIRLYEPRVTQIKILLLLLEFLLLQMKVHHPMGATEQNDLSYANSWHEWNLIISRAWFFLKQILINKIKGIFEITDESQHMHLLFTEVTVEVYHQFVYGIRKNVNLNSEPNAKRKKFNFDLPSFMDESLSLKEWQWLNLLSEVLNKYPEVITVCGYFDLLENLVMEQLNCLSPITMGHIYKCLHVLLNVEMSLNVDSNVTLDKWNIVWDSVVRSIGLNHTPSVTHDIACQLILLKKINRPEQLITTYLSRVVLLNASSLNTLNHLGQTQCLTEKNECPHVKLIDWILNCNESNSHFIEKVTAVTLMHLVLNQWPDEMHDQLIPNVKHNEFEEIYKFTMVKKGLFLPEKPSNNKLALKQYIVKKDCFDELIKHLRVFTNVSIPCKNVVKLMNTGMLCINLLYLMRYYNITNGAEIVKSMLLDIMPMIWELLVQIIGTIKEKQYSLFDILIDIIDADKSIGNIITDTITRDLITGMFTLLSEDFESEDSGNLRNRNLDEKLKFKFKILRFLCKYAMHGGNPTQSHALDALLTYSIDPCDEIDYKLGIIILQSLKEYEGFLSIAQLENVYNLITVLCRKRYNEYEVALNILNILCDLYVHVANADDEQVRENFVMILKPFFDLNHNYGPQVSISLANCIGKLIEVKHDFTFTKWSDSEYAILALPQLLTSEHQCVRIATIKNLVTSFMLKSVNYKEIKSLFCEVCKMTSEVFNEDCESYPDEITNRTASVLYTFANIIVVNSTLRQHGLFQMLKITHENKLKLEKVQIVLDEATTILKLPDSTVLLETHMDYIMIQWNLHKYSLKDLHYKLFQCNTDIEFYNKYMTHITSILICEEDTKVFETVCEYIGKTPTEVIEVTYPSLASKSLALQAFKEGASEFNVTPDDISLGQTVEKRIATYLTQETCQELVLEKIDEIIVHLMQLVYDAQHFNNQFGFECSIPEPESTFLSVQIFERVLEKLEQQIPNNNIMDYIMTVNPGKIQNIILRLTYNMQKATSACDTLLLFHRYTVFMQLCHPYLERNHDINPYLIQQVTFLLINIIRHQKDDVLSIMATKYFSIFIDCILPKSSSIFQEFIIFTVSIIVSTVDWNTEALVILKKLLVDYAKCLEKALRIMDPLPDVEIFRELRLQHLKIKFGKQKANLLMDIHYFLEATDHMRRYGDRSEGLKHLHKQLVENKKDLKEIYKRLYEMYGALKEGSLVHKLICTLVKLTGSDRDTECLEATRCLGELGAADLTTMVLKSEEKLENLTGSAKIISTVRIINMLADYIVDENIDVVLLASKSLHHIVVSTEGTQVIKKKHNIDMVDKSYLYPFISKKKATNSNNWLVNTKFLKIVLKNDDIWCPNEAISHEKWIVNLVSTILESFMPHSYFKSFIPIVKIKLSFAEELLPILVMLLIEMDPMFYKSLSTSIDNFFQKHWELHWLGIKNPEHVQMQRASLQCMLNVVHFVRLQRNLCNDKSSISELNLNYLHVALAAQFCSAHFSAIMYTEHWSQSVVLENKSEYNLSPFEKICKNSEDAKALQAIFRQSYIDIGDMDAIHKVKMINPLDQTYQLNNYIDSAHWDHVLLHCDVQLSHGHTEYETQMIDALNNFGLLNQAINNSFCDQVSYEALWRLGQWDFPIKSTHKKTLELYNYQTLKALQLADVSTFGDALSSSRNIIIDSLQHSSLESCKNLYEPLTKLQCLMELEEVGINDTDIHDLFKKWMEKDSINQNEFKYMERILSHRITMCNIILNKRCDVKEVVIDLQLNLAELARKNGNLQVAKRAILNLLNMENLDKDIHAKILIENAQIVWETDKTSATWILKDVLDISTNKTKLRAEALKLYGMWMAKMKTQSTQVIMHDYFLQSISIMSEISKQTNQNSDEFYECYNIIGNFADQEYIQILEYTKSSIFQTKVKNMEKLTESAAKMKKAPNVSDNDVRRAIIVCERQSGIDKIEIDNTLKEKDTYMTLAFKYYLVNLQNSNQNNVRMFRIISLWLENRANASINNLAKEYLPKISSFKILQTLPQIIPHITHIETDELFEKVIMKLIERCAVDHPHHVIPIIMSMAHSNKDDQYSDTSASTESNEPRVVGAQKLIKTLQSYPTLKNMIKQMEQTAEALIQLAYYEKKTDSNAPIKIPNAFKIRSINNFTEALLPTYTLAINQNKKYSEITGIYKFNADFNYVGGLNAPKRITCIGTDGKSYNQLIKGKDDLRQDAVMQQVFTIMNGLLRVNKTTTNLLIRTYKVLPLSKRSGVLEWVDNTMPFGDYLIGKQTGAHRLYNKRDWTPERARSEFKDLAHKNNEQKLKGYLKICQNFQPAFQKFFEITYLQPTIWYERRRAYTQSVATTSMCGYILGLGDRHVQNILVDKNTAEVIHIDFGIAFEQGKVLPTPETVPFRLSRDIEAGMGITGVEGTFRSSCEKTMEVLRQNSRTVQTILEVLLYDPLYAWTITPAQAYSRQIEEGSAGSTPKNIFSNDSSSENTQINVTAERALRRLQEKLHGTEYRGFTSVEGQVGILIQQARDPANLCRLFQGWQPYL